MADGPLVLSGAVLPDRADLGPVDVLVVDERIAQLAPAGSIPADRVWRLDGRWLLPGVIDAHVHPIHAETFGSVGRSSILGGITTVLNHLYPRVEETLVEAVARGTVGGRQGYADFGFHLRMTPDRLVGPTPAASVSALTDALRVVAEGPAVLSVKAFLAHTDPAVMTTWPQLVTIAAAAEAAELPVMVHAEPGDVLTQLDALQGAPNSLPEHDSRRSLDLEAAAVAMAAAVAHAVGSRLYIAHMSSADAVDAATRAAQLGTRIRGETCAHYLALDSGQDLGATGRVTPPLRGAGTVAALRRRVQNLDAAVHVVASDHCGYTAEEKSDHDFARAGNGLPGLEALLPLLLDGVLAGGWLEAADLVRLACLGAAEVFGLRDKAGISVGAHADLVVVDPAGSTDLAAHRPGAVSARSPYGGRRTAGAVQHVVRRGQVVVRDGAVTDDAGRGRPVRRGATAW